MADGVFGSFPFDKLRVQDDRKSKSKSKSNRNRNRKSNCNRNRNRNRKGVSAAVHT